MIGLSVFVLFFVGREGKNDHHLSSPEIRNRAFGPGQYCVARKQKESEASRTRTCDLLLSKSAGLPQVS